MKKKELERIVFPFVKNLDKIEDRVDEFIMDPTDREILSGHLMYASFPEFTNFFN